MFAQVYWFEEWSSWAVTIYDAEENRATAEADWFAFKGPAVTHAEGLLQRGEIGRYEVFTRAGRHERTIARVRPDGIAETRHSIDGEVPL